MKEKVLEILGEINDELLTYTGSNMLKDGIVNSFTFISLVEELEDEFDVEIDESLLDEEHFGNKDRILDLMKQLLK